MSRCVLLVLSLFIVFAALPLVSSIPLPLASSALQYPARPNAIDPPQQTVTAGNPSFLSAYALLVGLIIMPFAMGIVACVAGCIVYKTVLSKQEVGGRPVGSKQTGPYDTATVEMQNPAVVGLTSNETDAD